MVSAPTAAGPVASWLPRPRPPGLLPALLGVVLCGGVAAFTLANAAPDQRTAATLINILLVALPMGVALAILRGQPEDRFSRVLFAAGAAFSLTALSQSPDSLLFSVGRVAVWVVEPAVFFLLLAFPSGRLIRPLERRIMWAVATLVTVLYLPTAFIDEVFPAPSPFASCGKDCPPNAFAVADLQGLVDVMRASREVLVFLAAAAVVWAIARRLRGAGPMLRRALMPVLVIAIVQAGAYLSYQLVRIGGSVPSVVEFVGRLYVLSLPAVALSFAAGLLWRRLRVAGVVQELTVSLRAPATAAALRTRIAEALEDPSLRIVYWLPGRPGRWIDEAGWPASVQAQPPFRVVTEVFSEGHRVAAVLHDGTLAPDSRLVEAAASYGMVVLENTQLISDLRTSVQQLSEAEERASSVAAGERRRIERDLHDGAQQQLLALRIKLSLLGERLEREAPHAAPDLEALGEQIERTIEDVRTLARGSYPLLLAQQGLAHALRLAALDAAIPTIVRSNGVGRYSQQVESAVYFCCIEALQNALKHASGATAVSILLVDDGSLRFEVADDGPGFASALTPAGAGLRNITDRVTSVGGNLIVDPGLGRGTHVVGIVPVG